MTHKNSTFMLASGTLSGSGIESDIKQKRDEASIMIESMKRDVHLWTIHE